MTSENTETNTSTSEDKSKEKEQTVPISALSNPQEVWIQFEYGIDVNRNYTWTVERGVYVIPVHRIRSMKTVVENSTTMNIEINLTESEILRFKDVSQADIRRLLTVFNQLRPCVKVEIKNE